MSETNEKRIERFAIVNGVEASIPIPTEKRGYSGSRYIQYGEDNLYPDFLLGCYQQSSTLQSIINGLADYIAGSGFEEGDADLIVNEKGVTLGDMVQRTAVDYLVFGAFALGVRRNGAREVRYLDYHDPRTIRLNEEGDTALIKKDWSMNGKMVDVPIYYEKDTATDRMELYYKSPISRGLYGVPMWQSAAKDVQTSIEISTFHLSAIKNNFVPSAIVNFNNGTPDEETQHKIERRMNDKFSGATNAARLLLSWNESNDHATTIERLVEDNFDQRYQSLAKSVRENIFIAFRAHPQLFGADPERQGFNSVEYEQSFRLFKETVVKPIQSQIERAYASLGEPFRFRLAEFTINFDAGEGVQA